MPGNAAPRRRSPRLRTAGDSCSLRVSELGEVTVQGEQEQLEPFVLELIPAMRDVPPSCGAVLVTLPVTHAEFRIWRWAVSSTIKEIQHLAVDAFTSALQVR